MNWVETEPDGAESLYLGQEVRHMVDVRSGTRAHGGADGHRRAADGEVRQREGEDEQRWAVFT